MSRKFKTGAFAMALLILLPVLPVMAAPPVDVHIEVEATIDTSDLDPFVATGGAVGTGMLCPTGTVEDLEVWVSPPRGRFTRLRVQKRFACDNGSGTFDLNLVAHLDRTTHETWGRWRVVGGTGAYGSLRGRGRLEGTPMEPGVSILDGYDGRMH